MSGQQRIAFIGLGTMGGPMAGHLAARGHDVVVHNRTAARARDWTGKHGGRMAGTPAGAAQGAALVMTCVGNDDDLRSVVLGPGGALEGMAPGSILVDHTTASATVARELAAIAGEKGVEFLDAPVSGGQSGAEGGILTLMAGGSPGAYDRAGPVLDCYVRTRRLMGPAGSGQLAKMVNQLCIAGLLQGLAEGLALARAAGLDGPELVRVISKGAAGSWQMENRHLTMWQGKFDFGFAVDWMRKDLRICLDEASGLGVSLPVAALVDQFYADIQRAGGGRLDTSSLILRLEQAATLRLPSGD